MNTSEDSKQAPGQEGRVLVGLSGGIHSAVAAALLKTQGYELIGVFVDSQSAVPLKGERCEADGWEQAKMVAAQLAIDILRLDAAKLYEQEVSDYLIHESLQGRVPHPCVLCGQKVRVSTLLSQAVGLRCEQVATGHGARLVRDSRAGSFHLLRASDHKRDQSFYLFNLDQGSLSKMLFPLGGFSHGMVSKLAGGFKLDAQKVTWGQNCFVNSPAFSALLESRVAPALRFRGPVRSYLNEILGEHDGLYHFRIGMSPSLELLDKNAESYVVVGFELSTQTLILGPMDVLIGRECRVTELRWTKAESGLRGLECQALLAPRGEAVACRLTFFENDTARARFEKPVGPIINGQPIVFVKDEEILGGGWIRG